MKNSEYRTNCKNCGAPIHYEPYSGKAICDYCGTEYHVNKQGFITDNIVELELFGQKMKFYINSIEVEHHTCDYTCIDGSYRSCISSPPDVTLELRKIY
ncbi:hypothetical protein IJE86_02240 [bacterium]|nr:hypothetical protein [bacterium]